MIKKDILKFLIAIFIFYVALKTMPIWSQAFGNLMGASMKNSIENLNKK